MGKIKWKYANIVLSIICIGMVFCIPSVDMFQLTRTFALLLFMIIGMYARRFEILKWKAPGYIAILLLGVLIAAAWLGMDIYGYHFPLGVLNIVTASLISFAVVYWCGLLCRSRKMGYVVNCVCQSICRLFSFCGVHSLMILSFQAIYGAKFIRILYKHVGIHNPYVLMAIFMVTCVLSTCGLNSLLDFFRSRVRLVNNGKQIDHSHA